MKNQNVNLIVLKFFGPVLILTGIFGFLIPAEYSLMSGAKYYNIFHIIFGITGLTCVLTKNIKLIIGFNILFGVIDLYQFVASYLDFFPKSLFAYTITDDILHLVIGLALIAVGLIKREKKYSAL